MKLVVPDLISPSYFPAIAAAELGCFAERGVDVELDLQYPVTAAIEALRAGQIDLLAGTANAIFHGASDGGGVRILAALSRHTYWFLVVRADLGLRPGDALSRLAGLRIGAAPGPDHALVQLLLDSGVDPASVEIGPVPGTASRGVSFGVTAAEALAAGAIDGFWANGMGAEVAVRAGAGTVLVDARRGDGPPALRRYTFPALMSTTRLLEQRPDDLARVVAGLVDAQRRLRLDLGASTKAAERLFPPMEAELTPILIARDSPFYDPVVGEQEISDMVSFALDRGLTDRRPSRADLVALAVADQWQAR